ncbi:hypothetical protein Tco_0769033 [Tanacetum coccineum]|uniref:Reverse transcriptase Ty1/copia-type domain-containing protein n=1 Tax=Tanacetum coccineum TaxID=301880 RepID=A0ABQ4ZBN6_9ASTR
MGFMERKDRLRLCLSEGKKSQDKYVTEILKKFGFTNVKTASTPMETQKPLLKDADVCACARFQVNLKRSHLHAVKRIFRYLKGQPKLGLWYPKDSPFDLVAYTDSDYAGASLDRKSITGGCLEWNEKAAKDEIGKGIGVNAGDSKLMLLGINLLLLEKVNAARPNLLLLVATAKGKNVNGEVSVTSLVDGKQSDQSLRQERNRDRGKPLKISLVRGPTKPIADEAANEENVPTQSNDPPLSREDASKQGRKIADIDADAEVTLIDETQGETMITYCLIHVVLGLRGVEVEKGTSETVERTVGWLVVKREQNDNTKSAGTEIFEHEVAKKQKIDDAKVEDDH